MTSESKIPAQEALLNADLLSQPASLRELARDLICARIITGDLMPEHIYSARMLAERLGVSATPIREAMLDLSRDHMLVPVRNKGFRVPKLSEHVLTELYELRMLLEPASIRRVAGRLDELKLQHAEELVLKIENAAARDDLDVFIAADRDFHLGLLETLGNERLVEIVGSLRNQQRLYGLTALSRAGLLKESAQEHREMLSCLVRGDGRAAERLMVHHLHHTRGVWAGEEEAGEIYADSAGGEAPESFLSH